MAWWIAEEVTGMTQTQLILDSVGKDTEVFADTQAKENVFAQINTILQRLERHEPIQHIFGHCWWRGLEIKVTSDTLIPRPETAELVDWVLQENDPSPRTVLDCGTGSGCIAIALKKLRPTWKITGMDISANALSIAVLNAQHNTVEIQWKQGDILQNNPISSDIIISNPPYIRPTDTMDESVREYEPTLALMVSEDDPCIFYRAIARRHAPQVYVEINEHLAEITAAVFKQAGYTDVRIRQDSYGKDRFIAARILQ